MHFLKFVYIEGKETLKYRWVAPRPEKFKIVNNDHGRTQTFDFSV